MKPPSDCLSWCGILLAALLSAGPLAAQDAGGAKAPSPWDGAVAVFDYYVRDVDAAVRFYRDGIGMREVQSKAGDKILEYAGGCLRFLPAKVSGPAPQQPRNPIEQITASNGYRYLSLFLRDVPAAEDRLVKAGYAKPVKGGRLSMTRDPDGNVVEFVTLRAGATDELFTVGMAVQDEAASLKFYGEALGLKAEAQMRLPPPFAEKRIYPYSIGSARVKLYAPDGKRPLDSDAPLDAPGIHCLNILVGDVAVLRESLNRHGVTLKQADTPGTAKPVLTLADPDGNRITIAEKGDFGLPNPTPPATATTPAKEAEGKQPERARADAILAQFDRNRDGSIDREEYKASRLGRERPELFDRLDRNRDGHITQEELGSLGEQAPGTPRQGTQKPPDSQIDDSQPRQPGEPPLRKMPPGDAADDARGRGQLFESIVIPGFTDIVEGTNGIVLVDLNRDGRLDIVATYSAPRGSGNARGDGEKLRVFINEGDFQFKSHPIKILNSKVSPENFGRGQVPVLADFNGDGFLDIFVTRNANMLAGESRPGVESIGNSLFITRGAWDTFEDVSESMGIRNEKGYNRQPSIGDVNRDGWLDIAIGCDNIKNALGGFPHSRLYVFRPKGPRFEDGKFEDIGGTDLVPDFGGFYHDSTRDKAGPDINLRDLDGDGDLDLIQSCHVDVREPLLPYWPGEYRQGVFCWKNLLAETGQLRFEKVTGNGLACEARLKYNREKQVYEPVGKAPGLPYISLADVNNDGLLDVLAVGPAHPGWAPRAEYVGGRFWKNLGGFRFQETTEAAGLSALNFTYRQWAEFFDSPAEEAPKARRSSGGYQSQPGLPRTDPLESIPYFADAVFGDYNNDGWVDVVVLDRSESSRHPSRAVLFMNQGDGTFKPMPTTFSGLDGSGICGEVADLNGDGLLDLVFAADPDNSGPASGPDRYQDKVYWNTGAHGGRQNHWLRLRFSGVKDTELIGARVDVRESGTGKLLGTRWIHSNQSYKSGGALEAHFGLGQHARVDFVVTLPSGRKIEAGSVETNRFVEFDLAKGTATTVNP